MFGERIGERRTFVRIAHQPDPATGQIRETVGRGKHTHARAESRLGEHGHREPRKDSGGNGASIRTRVKYTEWPADRFERLARNEAPGATRPAERKWHARLQMCRMPIGRHPK